MPFISLTSDGLDIACFLAEQSWESAPSISFYFPVDITTGLSNRQARRPKAEALLLTAAVELWAEESEAQALRQQFATLGKGWVGLPIIADEFDGADAANAAARFLAPQRLLDITAQQIVASTDELTSGHRYAPLLVGHITDLPPIEPASGALALCSVIVTEDSPWTFRIGIQGSHTPGTWPASLLPEWSTPPTETPVKELEFARIGAQREQTIAQEERAFYWSSEASFTLTNKTEIAALLGFFLASRGPWRPFDAPMWFTPGSPTAEAPHETKVHFAEPVLKLGFTTSHVAECRIQFAQLPWEILGTDGEEPLQPPRIFLYRFRYDLPTPVYFRFTNCWRPLTRADDGTYDPAPMLHDAIDDGGDLDNDSVTLETFEFPGSPLLMFNPLTLEGRLWLEIFEIETDPIDPDAAVSVWCGTVVRAPQTGRELRAECKWLGGVLDREIPTVRVGPGCNTYLFSSRCGHSKAAFERTGTLTLSSANTVEVTTTASDAANTYAPGWIEVGSGTAWELRSITASEPITGGQQFSLDWPLRQSATGQAVKFYRGCDRLLSTCQALDPSGWRARFRGFPNLPQVNLSLPTAQTAAPGKK